jgi:hypothetical protein
MKKLLEDNWTISQYHPPGGQAQISLLLENGRVTPDIIAIKNRNILVTENKGKESEADYVKLKKMSEDKMFQQQVYSHIQSNQQTLTHYRLAEIQFIWAHAYDAETHKNGHQGIYSILISEQAELIKSLPNNSFIFR